MKRPVLLTLFGAITVAVLLAFTVLRDHSLSPREFMAWVADPENGLVMEKKFDDYRLQLQYRPIEHLAIAEIGERINAGELDRFKVERSGAHHFNLRLEPIGAAKALHSGTTDPEAFNGRIYYLTSEVESDLALVIGADTLPCSMAHLERTYGAAPYDNLVIAFADHGAPAREKGMQLLFNDRAFGLGSVSFAFTPESLSDVPSIQPFEP